MFRTQGNVPPPLAKQRPISFDAATTTTAIVGNRSTPPTPLDKMLFSQASNLAERLYSDSPVVSRTNNAPVPQKPSQWTTNSAPQSPAAFAAPALPKRYSENASAKAGAPTHSGIAQFQYTSTTPQMSPDMARNQPYPGTPLTTQPGIAVHQGVVTGPPPVPVAPARHVRRPSGGK